MALPGLLPLVDVHIRNGSSFPYKGILMRLISLHPLPSHSLFTLHSCFPLQQDTVLTEKLDYYSAFVGIVYAVYIAVVRIFWIQRRPMQLLVALPFAAIVAWHLHYMNFVNFNYGWNMTLLIVFSALHSVLWFSWAAYARPPYVRALLVPAAITWSLAALEFFDFAPLLLLFEPHSLWHLGLIFSAAMWKNFLVLDAHYHLNKSKLP
jgi:hypothetical protein